MANNIYLPGVPLIPGALLISAIANTFPMVVTIVNSIYNTYIVDQLVTFIIPPQYGMTQLNSLTGQIVAIVGLTFSVNIDARQFDIFVIPNPSSLPTPSQPATLAPGGSRNLYNIATEAFQSLNNIGN